MPASNIVCELSGDATVMSMAAEVPQSQLVTRMSVLELSCPHPQPTSIKVCRYTSSLKGAVDHVSNSVVPGCYITSFFPCDTVVTQRVSAQLGHRGQTI